MKVSCGLWSFGFIMWIGTAAATAADARTSVAIGKNGRPDARAIYKGTRGGVARTQAQSGRHAFAEALAVGHDHDGSSALSYSRPESSHNHHEQTEIRISQTRNQQTVSVDVSGSHRSGFVVTGDSVFVVTGGTYVNQTHYAVISTACVFVSESVYDEDVFDEPLFIEGECHE